MNKYLLILGIAVLLLAVELSGCNSTILNPELDRFVGTWYLNQGTSVDLGQSVTFFSDGSITLGIMGNTGTYEIEEGKLAINIVIDTNKLQFLYDYSFSEDGSTLTLTSMINGATSTYGKE